MTFIISLSLHSIVQTMFHQCLQHQQNRNDNLVHKHFYSCIETLTAVLVPNYAIYYWYYFLQIILFFYVTFINTIYLFVFITTLFLSIRLPSCLRFNMTTPNFCNSVSTPINKFTSILAQNECFLHTNDYYYMWFSRSPCMFSQNNTCIAIKEEFCEVNLRYSVPRAPCNLRLYLCFYAQTKIKNNTMNYFVDKHFFKTNIHNDIIYHNGS